MKVFLDMDGVLVDFRRGVCEIFGQKDDPASWTFWEYWEGVTTGNVNAKCNDYFWKYLNWTHDGQEIEQAIRDKFNSDNIYLLTTPMLNTGSGTGKLQWIKWHMPWVYSRTIISYAPKSLLAGPNTLLIDDKDENIEEFRAAGGRGILVPRPWNKNHDCQRSTLDYVKHKLDEVRI
jgi:5'(3')-deoxyribonucleotidase